ncbi:MAG: serine/threonine-protein kinase [Akkermansiaceae bacterium]
MPSSKNYEALLAQGLNNEEEAYPVIEGLEIIKKLGHGGMGSVYLAYDQELDRKVALKVFHPGSLDPMSLERIRQESVIMARAQHPHVLAIYHVKSHDLQDSPFSLVLEYAAGGDLAQKISSEGALSLQETVRICLQICDGLSSIHALKIIHRDIKPANILLTTSHNVKIADLGIAKDTTADSLTMTGSYLGSMLYVAPEQMTGNSRTIDHRADIWSMGIMIYEMLVGSPPKAILESELMAPLPEIIRPLVRQCLMQNPENRYPYVAELKSALIHVLQPQHLSAVQQPSEMKVNKSHLAPILIISATTLILTASTLYFLSNKTPNTPSTNKPITDNSKVADSSEKINPNAQEEFTTPINNEIKLTSLLTNPLQPDQGTWELSEDGKLSCGRSRNGACISFPVIDLGDEYDLSFNVVRTVGKDSLAVFIPTAIGTVTFELDAWNKQLTGIQALDGLNLKQHQQTILFKMTNRQNYQILIQVRTDYVQVEIDGNFIYNCDLSGKRGSIINLWSTPRQHSLSIGSWNSKMTFNDLILKKIP